MVNSFKSKKLAVMDLDDYTVLDTEYICYTNKIYQVGLLKIRDKKIIQQESILINPQQKKGRKDYELNDITDEQLEQANTIDKEIESIVELIGDDILVGYNVKTSDIDKLSDAYFDKTGRRINNDYVDVMEIVKESNLPLTNGDENTKPEYKLEKVCDYLGFIEKRHDALEDCISTYKLYEILKFIPKQKLATEIIIKNKKNKHSNSTKGSRYLVFERTDVNPSLIRKTDLSELRFVFSDCAGKIDRNLSNNMKLCGISNENLYESVTKRDRINYCIIPDIDNPTGNAKKAQKYGGEVISFDDFCKWVEQVLKDID